MSAATRVRMVGRCYAFECGTRVNVPARTLGADEAARYLKRPGAVVIDATWTVGDRRVSGSLDMRERWHRGLFAFCIEHRAPISFRKLRATWTDTVCSGACVRAEGRADVCRCSCGGANHGIEA